MYYNYKKGATLEDQLLEKLKRLKAMKEVRIYNEDGRIIYETPEIDQKILEIHARLKGEININLIIDDQVISSAMVRI